MLQRIQTIYLFIATISCVVTSIFFHTINDTNNIKFTYDSIFYMMYLVFGLDLFINIFLYKKRKMQIKINTWLYYLQILVLLFLGYKFFKESISEYYILLFPFLSIILTLLANNAIKKDEELVRSTERIR